MTRKEPVSLPWVSPGGDRPQLPRGARIRGRVLSGSSARLLLLGRSCVAKALGQDSAERDEIVARGPVAFGHFGHLAGDRLGVHPRALRDPESLTELGEDLALFGLDLTVHARDPAGHRVDEEPVLPG